VKSYYWKTGAPDGQWVLVNTATLSSTPWTLVLYEGDNSAANKGPTAPYSVTFTNLLMTSPGATDAGTGISPVADAGASDTPDVPGGSGTNLLINGSFEANQLTAADNGCGSAWCERSFSSTPGWTQILDGVDLINNNYQQASAPVLVHASDGVQFLDMNQAGVLGGIEQVVTVNVGTNYRLTLDTCAWATNSVPGTIGYELYDPASSAVLDSGSFTDSVGGTWVTRTLEAVAISSSIGVRIQGLAANAAGMGLDHVVLVPVGSGKADGGGSGDGVASIDAGQSDPHFSNVVLLMHFDGANGATSFTDVKGHAVTPHGSSALSSTTSAFGGSSGHFDGSSAWLSLAYSDDWNFYAGDFTVELFVNFTGGVAGQTLSPVLFQFWDGPNSHGWWQLGYDRANPGNDLIPGTLTFVFSLTGSDEVPPATTWTPAANTWYHVASVRHGSDFLFFVNGALVGSQSLGANGGPVDWTQESSGTWVAGNVVAGDASIQSKSTTDFATPLEIGVGVGTDSVPNPWTYFNGYMDEARITKGVARYTANFTPPTGPFPDK